MTHQHQTWSRGHMPLFTSLSRFKAGSAAMLSNIKPEIDKVSMETSVPLNDLSRIGMAYCKWHWFPAAVISRGERVRKKNWIFHREKVFDSKVTFGIEEDMWWMIVYFNWPPCSPVLNSVLNSSWCIEFTLSYQLFEI